MIKNAYYKIMILLVACFVPLLFIIESLELNLFATQISVFMILLTFSAVTLFMFARSVNLSWSFSLLLFSLHLMNAVYLFLFKLNLALVFYSVAALIGFIYSVYNIDDAAKKHISTKIKILKKPKKIVKKNSLTKKIVKKKNNKKSVTKKVKKSKKKIKSK